MNFFKTTLALIGTIAIVVCGVGYVKVNDIISEFDPGAAPIYRSFVKTLLEAKDPSSALVLAVPVREGVVVADVKESLKRLAAARNVPFIGEDQSGEHVTYMIFGDARFIKMMTAYNRATSAFIPCRISVVEDEKGRLWLYAMRLDMVISGGKPLPPELRQEAIQLWGAMGEIMNGAANGDT